MTDRQLYIVIFVPFVFNAATMLLCVLLTSNRLNKRWVSEERSQNWCHDQTFAEMIRRNEDEFEIRLKRLRRPE